MGIKLSISNTEINYEPLFGCLVRGAIWRLIGNEKYKAMCWPFFISKIISSHSFDNYINILHKTEVQTVILRCLTCLNLNLNDTFHSLVHGPEPGKWWFCIGLDLTNMLWTKKEGLRWNHVTPESLTYRPFWRSWTHREYVY